MNLTDLIRVYPNVALADWCQSAIDVARQHQFDHHKTPGYEFYQISASQTKALKPYSDQFLEVFCNIAEEYFRDIDMYQFIEQTGFSMIEDIRIKRYIANSDMRFDEHVDVVDLDSASRYLIGILYLNDNNGDTVFRDISIRPTVGSMVVFPPMWMFPHKAKTPTDTDKYIMMSSLRY